MFLKCQSKMVKWYFSRAKHGMWCIEGLALGKRVVFGIIKRCWKCISPMQETLYLIFIIDCKSPVAFKL